MRKMTSIMRRAIVVAGFFGLVSSSAFAQPVSKGIIDGVSGNTVSGWACTQGIAESVGIHVYIGGSHGNYGVETVHDVADQPSEPAVALACGSGFYNHRFAVDLTGLERAGGMPIWIYAINGHGGPNPLLTNSGAYSLPGGHQPLPPSNFAYSQIIDFYGFTWDAIPGISYYRFFEVSKGGVLTETLVTGNSYSLIRSPTDQWRWRIAACTTADVSSCGQYSNYLSSHP